MKKNLPIKLEIIALVLFSMFTVFIIEAWNTDPNPNVEKYILYLYIDFSILLSMIILIIRNLMIIFKHKDEKELNALPKDANGYYISTNSFHKEGLYTDSIANYDKAIELNPKFADAYLNRAFAYIKIGYRDKAKKDFKKAKELKEEQKLKN